MDFMKVFDQTVREIKREVNLKVLKVPEIEQKVLDATDNEPWGPHGTALAEIAQATNKFSEYPMVMNVLWTRLGETGKDWRYVYKALAVIEYLISHGSERAVDEIIEHTFQISSLSSFEYVEPSGKDMGINVRKKSENIVALLNNRDKIQEVRNKAAENREKYFGLSSTGITYKSGSASYGSSSVQSSDRYGGFRDDSYKDRDRYGEEKDTFGKSRRGTASENQGSTLKKGSRYSSKDKDNISFNASKSATKSNDSDNYSSVPSKKSSGPSNNYDDDDFDDFDPRGVSSKKSTAGRSNEVDLFGGSLIDVMDETTSVPAETSAMNGKSSEVDLFADAAFVSAKPHRETGSNSQTKTEVDLFASQPAVASVVPAPVDLFGSDPVVQPEAQAPKFELPNANIVDPFAAVPLNSYDGSDLFGAFASNSDSVSKETSQDPTSDSGLSNLGGKSSSVSNTTNKNDTSNLFGAFTSNSDSVSTETNQNPTIDSGLSNLGGKSSSLSNTPNKKDSFQVKSGIWADSLSRGLIDLNISASKKVSLADIGVVGGLSDGSDEREKGLPTSFYMGRAMGSGSGLGRSGFTSSPATAEELFSNVGGQQYQFGSFQK